MTLPPCGIYKTTDVLGSVAAGHLVYFHNHGDPGPGIYLPESWRSNRATFRKQGFTLPSEGAAKSLLPLSAEGFYRVTEEFVCCDKRCVTFPPELLVQLGYNGHAEPILFRPVLSPSGLAIPEKGQLVDADRMTRLSRVLVAEEHDQNPAGDLH